MINIRLVTVLVRVKHWVYVMVERRIANTQIVNNLFAFLFVPHIMPIDILT